jgi:hypothetical protein
VFLGPYLHDDRDERGPAAANWDTMTSEQRHRWTAALAQILTTITDEAMRDLVRFGDGAPEAVIVVDHPS